MSALIGQDSYSFVEIADQIGNVICYGFGDGHNNLTDYLEGGPLFLAKTLYQATLELEKIAKKKEQI